MDVDREGTLVCPWVICDARVRNFHRFCLLTSSFSHDHRVPRHCFPPTPLLRAICTLTTESSAPHPNPTPAKAHELGYAHLDALSPLVLSLLRLGEHKAAMNVAAGGMAASHKQGDQLGVSTCAFLSAYALHLQRSDIAAEVLESSLEAAREATPRSAAVGDMLKCAGVHLELVGGDAAGGRERLTSAVRFFEKHHGGAPEEAAKALVHLGALEGRAGDREASEAHFSRALALLGGVYGDAHPRLSRALRPLARAYRGFGEPVLAEGLYRSSVDNLKAAAEHTPGCDTAQAAVELAGNLREFAALMDGLEWNGRARTAEADELRAEADAVLARFPRLPPPDSESLWDESLCERYDQPFK